MSDREQLAARLVEAAAAASWISPAPWDAPSVQQQCGAIYRDRTRLAVAAAFRELAEGLAEAERHHDALGRIHHRDLSGLADYIEKGAGDGT